MFETILLEQVLPNLPLIVRFIESLFGGAKGVSQQKLDTAVSIVQTVVPAVVGHLKAEPANTPKLVSLVNTVVAGINAANSWQQQPATILGIPQQPSA